MHIFHPNFINLCQAIIRDKFLQIMLTSQSPNQSTRKEEFNTNTLVLEDHLNFGAAVKRAFKQHNYLLDYNSNKVKSHNREILLTSKEFHTLEYLIKHPNQIITGLDIRTYLQKMTSGCSCVVADQIRTLRQKFISTGCPNPIETIQDSCYRFRISS